jgi:hypothetical protein
LKYLEYQFRACTGFRPTRADGREERDLGVEMPVMDKDYIKELLKHQDDQFRRQRGLSVVHEKKVEDGVLLAPKSQWALRNFGRM